MSRNVMNGWHCEERRLVWPEAVDFEQEGQYADKASLTDILRQVEHREWKVHLNPLSSIEEDWKPQPPPQKPEEVIPCHIVELEGREAVCAMIVDGYELPRVSFPSWVLRRKGLQVGSRFNWLVRDPGRVRPSDIDTNVSEAEDSATVDLARLEELHAEMKRGLAEDGGEWPIYTGDGT